MPDTGWQPLPPCGNKPRPFGRGAFAKGPFSNYGMNVWIPVQCGTADWISPPPCGVRPRPYGVGPYGVGPYSTYGSNSWQPWQPCSEDVAT